MGTTSSVESSEQLFNARRYYMIERKGAGVKSHYRAREEQVVSNENNTRMVKIAWQRYFFNEGETSHPETVYDASTLERAEQPPYNKYLSFIQTVGIPERFFKLGQPVICMDSAERPLKATIQGVEKNYYHVVYDKNQSAEAPYEWIHRNSSRIKARNADAVKREAKRAADAKTRVSFKTQDDFDRISLNMFAKALYPPDGTLLPARVIRKDTHSKDKNAHYIVLQFEQYKLCQQTSLTREEVNDGGKLEIKSPSDGGASLDAEHRANHYISSLRVQDKVVVKMDRSGGHSLFRALSHQLFGTETNWKAVRNMCSDHINKHKDYFQHFIDCEFEVYLAAKRRAERLPDYYAPGDHLDLQAICELYDCAVHIYSDKADQPLDEISFYGNDLSLKKSDMNTILLFYRGDDEYDSIINIRQNPPVPLMRKIGFQRKPKPLGELDPGDIKGIVLESRKRAFATWLKNSQRKDAQQTNAVEVCTYEALWKWDPSDNRQVQGSSLITINAMCNQLMLDPDSSHFPSKLEVKLTRKDKTLRVEIKKVDSNDEEEDPLADEGIEFRKFIIIGRSTLVRRAVDFCESSFANLRMEQSSSGTLALDG